MNISRLSLSILLLVFSSIVITKPTLSSENINSRHLTREQIKLLAAKIMKNAPERSYYYEDTKFTWVVVTDYFDKRAPKDLQDEVVKELQKKYTVYLQINDIPDNLIKKYASESRYLNGFSFSFWIEIEPDEVVKVSSYDRESMFSFNSCWTRYRWTGTDWMIIEQDEPNAKKQYFLNKYMNQIDQIRAFPYLEIKGHVKPKVTLSLTGDKLRRSRIIADAFLKEEAGVLGISDLNDLTGGTPIVDGSGGSVMNFKETLEGLTVEPCGDPWVQIIVGPDESIVSFLAQLVPISPEMRNAASKTISKEAAEEIVKNSLISQVTTSNLSILRSVKYFQTGFPYIIWHIRVGNKDLPWEYKLNAISGEVISFQKRKYKDRGCEF